MDIIANILSTLLGTLALALIFQDIVIFYAGIIATIALCTAWIATRPLTVKIPNIPKKGGE